MEMRFPCFICWQKLCEINVFVTKLQLKSWSHEIFLEVLDCTVDVVEIFHVSRKLQRIYQRGILNKL